MSQASARQITVKLPTLHSGQVKAYENRTRFYAVRCGRRWGKALALTTPIPTPSGWTTMGALEPGDQVFDEEGNVCNVIGATDVMLGRPCNRVIFSDKSELVADDEHLWLTWDNVARRGRDTPRIRTTKQIAQTVSNKRGDAIHSIPCTKSLKLPEKRFLIDPYVLGAWLGDGSSQGACFTCHPKDAQIIEEIREAGQPVRRYNRPNSWILSDGVMGGIHYGRAFSSKLRALGLLHNKHIPSAYFRASASQRLALLQGLMDTDGHSQGNGRCEFSNMRKPIALGLQELALSLGIRATFHEGRAMLNGRDCGPSYRVRFTTSKPVFRLKRKLQKIYTRKARFDVEQRMIVAVKRIKSVPVRCIMVDSESSLYLAGRSFIPTHNTTFGSIIACDSAVNSELIGWFAPDYKRMTEAFYEATQILQPVRKFPSGDKGVIRTITGGRIDFWTLEDEDAGRSRKYHKVIIDEAAFANDNMMDVWRKAIKPTLLDYRGRAMVLSNTNGVHPDQFFWRICNEPEHGFTEFHAPSIDNPLLPADEIENLQKSEHPLVFAQEYRADFVDWSGVAFFAKEKLLDQGKPVALPAPCDAVFAVIDTAVKAGKEHDGTACTYYAANKHGKYPLVIADWDLIQIEGASLVDWLPSVFSNLETLARRCKARAGSLGAFIEDAQSGSILLQQARKKGWAASALPENLKDMGKDGRALNISGHVYSGKVKLSVDAYDKTVNFKGASRNHLLTQITSFRIGDKDAAKRADDLLDTFTYGVAISLGNAQGY